MTDAKTFISVHSHPSTGLHRGPAGIWLAAHLLSYPGLHLAFFSLFNLIVARIEFQALLSWNPLARIRFSEVLILTDSVMMLFHQPPVWSIILVLEKLILCPVMRECSTTAYYVCCFKQIHLSCTFWKSVGQEREGSCVSRLSSQIWHCHLSSLDWWEIFQCLMGVWPYNKGVIHVSVEVLGL